ncbi:MAG: hypothetical protein MJA82_04220 [Clostridia bacterium]|nr:hypothetical protein [Clostridia bacterium]
MKNFFRPFNAESLLVALGLTFITYMITPIARELFRQITSTERRIYKVEEGNESKIVMNKGSL